MLILFWGWRVNIFNALPGYGDVLEVPWSVWWLDQTWFHGRGDWLFDPQIFFPAGWYVATFAQRPIAALLLLPFAKLGGLAFAVNVASLLSFAVAFSGMRRLSLRFLTPFAATLAALLFTFWGFRWLRIGGHMHMLLGTSLLPWIIWTLERGFDSSRHQWRWFVGVGLLWALAMSLALYLVWIGALVIGGWVISRWLSKQIDWRQAFSALLISSFIAVALNVSFVYTVVQAQRTLGSPFHSIHHINGWGASLNSLPIPFVFHPWLSDLSRSIYTGELSENGVANFGLFTFLFALIGAYSAKRHKIWVPVIFITVVGLTFTLGFTLKWNGHILQIPQLQPINHIIWQIGHLFKPQLFPDTNAPPPFAEAVPLPALLLVAIVPFWEGARTLSRYAFVADIGFFLLVALGVSQLPKMRWQWLFAVLLIIEILPPPQRGVPFPPETHQAFEWLNEQTQNNQGIIDLYASQPNKLTIPIRGEIAWQSTLHQWPTVSGLGSIFPAQTVFLQNWLDGHLHPFSHPEFVKILDSYRVRYLLLHVQGEYEQAQLEEANQNPELNLVTCFPPPNVHTPWPYPICIYELLSQDEPHFNLIFDHGWSEQESWGRWMEGTEAQTRWVVSEIKTNHLLIEAFPHCDSTQIQQIILEVNNSRLATYEWSSCETWSEELTIPAERLKVGWNRLIIRTAYAMKPIELTEGTNGDARMLSVGFNKLKVE